MTTWKPSDRVAWNPVGSDYPHPTIGTVLGFGETSGQHWGTGLPRPPEPYYVVELDTPVTLTPSAIWPRRETPLVVTELRVLGSALEKAP